jgi:hypothetical protein
LNGPHKIKHLKTHGRLVMGSSIRIEDFKLFNATFEVRYDNAYILWDSAGKIWSEVGKKFNKMTLEKAEPNVTSFLVDDRFKASVLLDKFYIIDVAPQSSLKDFISASDVFAGIVSKFLEIKVFTRIGFRLVFLKEFASKSGAADMLLDSGLIKVPQGKIMNIESHVTLPQISYSLEGDNYSARILLQAREKKIDFEAPPEVKELESVHVVKNELLFDLDYSTTKNVSIGQLDIKEWLSQAYHVIRRDSSVLFGGK